MAFAKRQIMDLMLGFFVVAALFLLGMFIFAVGKERRLFDTSVYLYANFPNVAGLSVGADVLLSGVVVGHVSSIRFPDLQSASFKKEVLVTLRVSKDTLPWIRKDSVVRVDSKGLLGEKNINISMGSPKSPPVKDGDRLTSVKPLDFNEAFEQVQNTLDGITGSVIGVRKLVEGFVEQDGDKSLAKAVHHLANIAKEIEEGKGPLHTLIYNKEAGKNIKDTIQSIKQSAEQLAPFVQSAAQVAGEMEKVLKDVRTKPSLLHALIYDSTQSNALESLNRAASDLQTIVTDIKQGEGTVGRLLADPSVYEDIRELLGSVRRNVLLKAVVRMGISQKASP